MAAAKIGIVERRRPLRSQIVRTADIGDRHYHPPVLRLIYRHLTDGPLLPVPEFDADDAILDAALRRARRDVRRGDWTAAGAVIQEAGDDWELRNQRIGSLS